MPTRSVAIGTNTSSERSLFNGESRSKLPSLSDNWNE